MDFKNIKSCRICGYSNLRKYLDLGSLPLPNKLLNQKFEKVEKYPLEVLFCEDCGLSQLSIVVNPELMFTDYLYHSSISKTFKDHCFKLAKSLKSNYVFKNDPPSLTDIACNDGALMREFKKEGFVVRGYEPCKELADIARGYDINKEAPKSPDDLNVVVQDYWCKKNCSSARSWSGEDVITATNVLAHVHNLKDFLQGVLFHLENNRSGIFIAEFPYLVNLIRGNQFDTVYHEHLSYFLFKPLKRLFNLSGLPIFKVELVPIHGGSLRIYASQNYYPESKSVKEIEKLEESKGFYKFETYAKFGDRVNKTRNNLVDILGKLRRRGDKVMAYGASAKGITLLNYCGLNDQSISMIVDDTKEKQNKFTPGSSIPIVDYSKFSSEKPDYIVLLAWNFEKELMNNTIPHKNRGGKYIIPIPEVKII